jgi:signal peptidase I
MLKSFFQVLYKNKIVLSLFVGIILTRVFVMDMFLVPTGSMIGAILENEYILVNKFSYGARVPDLNVNNGWNYRRLFRGEINRNDVIVFNSPEGKVEVGDDWVYFPASNSRLVKRCIGIPGDTITLHPKGVRVNGEIEKDLPTFKLPYKVEVSSIKCYKTVVEGLLETPEKLEGSVLKLHLTQSQASELSKNQCIKSVVRYFSNDVTGKDSTFLVPKKHMTLSLNKDNVTTYGYLIANYERNKVEVKDGAILINDEPSLDYTFKMDYFFALGDNRSGSSDSRVWGLIPEDHVIGKAFFILYSSDKGKVDYTIRWKRIFETI